MSEATPTPARYKRMNAEPYLDNEKFDSEEEALSYLNDPTCYAGHPIAVKGSDGKYALRMVNEGSDGQKVLDEAAGSGGGSADQVGELTPEMIETKEGSQQKADAALTSAKTYADGLIERLMNAPPETLDTLAELAAALGNDPNFATTMANALAQKASKDRATASEDGLMSSSDKAKLDGIAAGANKTIVDSALSGTSANPVQNKAVKAALDKKLDKEQFPGDQAKSIILNYDELDGNLPSDVVTKMKSNEYALFAKWNANYPYHLVPISYIYMENEWRLFFLAPPHNKTNEYGRLVRFLYDAQGRLKESAKYICFKTDGDGTKFLNDAGQYEAIPQQERGSVIFHSHTCFSDSGPTEPDSELVFLSSQMTPTGIAPIADKDYILYDNGTKKGLLPIASVSQNGNLYSVICSGKNVFF